ncbi:eukaryotic translation initiation factor 2B subunit beta [Brevipalpus obovatus]|uniref:eukaryotic translation initiation factor 2B subunit beta n=1 Tax=Brevipalpus obovatus TaxID=246614 RepID=UPI003D9E9BAE
MNEERNQICATYGVDTLVDDLKSGKIGGCYHEAFRTTAIVQQIVKDYEWQTAEQLIELLSYLGEVLDKATSVERVSSNIILRVSKGVRDEYESLLRPSKGSSSDRSTGFDAEEMLPKMMIIDDDDVQKYDQKLPDLRENLIDYLNELDSELEASPENIASKSVEQIHDGQVILTIGNSKSVELFLKYANRKVKRMKVIVAESGLHFPGHELAIKLAESGIDTTLIPDSAIFAVMSKVNRVIIGTHSVMANGGLKSISGSYTLSLAAKHYSVPLTVCTPIFKICPYYPISHDQVAFNKLDSPHHVYPYERSPFFNEVDIANPLFDYVPPELINGFVTNWGCYNPSYVYRLLSELYHRRDYL